MTFFTCLAILDQIIFWSTFCLSIHIFEILRHIIFLFLITLKNMKVFLKMMNWRFFVEILKIGAGENWILCKWLNIHSLVLHQTKGVWIYSPQFGDIWKFQRFFPPLFLHLDNQSMHFFALVACWHQSIESFMSWILTLQIILNVSDRVNNCIISYEYV